MSAIELDSSRDLESAAPSASRAVISSVISLVLPSDLSIESWRNIGEHISKVSSSSSWWLGDWLVFGCDKYPDRYKRAMAKTSLDYQTLRNYAWIARRFAPERRRESLSFQHHVEVAALPEAEQEHWLNFAEKFGWSRNGLRKQLRASYEENRELDQAVEVNLRLQVAKDLIERCQQAANEHGTELTEWIFHILEKAVSDNSRKN